MALIVETGAGVTGANSYVSLVDAQAFADARGLSVVLTEGLLMLAMDQLNSLRFNGVKSDSDNPLPYPRTGAYDCEYDLIDEDVVPAGIIAAQVWIAVYTAQGSDPSAVATPQIKFEKVDVLEVEYAVSDGATTGVSIMSMPNVRNALRCLTTGGRHIDRA